jgi:hypothetical protein
VLISIHGVGWLIMRFKHLLTKTSLNVEFLHQPLVRGG